MKASINILISACCIFLQFQGLYAQQFKLTYRKDCFGIDVKDSCGNVLRESPCIFSDVRLPDSSGSPAVAKIASSKAWVAIDTLLDVKFTFPDDVFFAYGFRHGMCCVEDFSGYSYGIVDACGNFIFDMKYDFTYILSEGTAIAMKILPSISSNIYEIRGYQKGRGFKEPFSACLPDTLIRIVPAVAYYESLMSFNSIMELYPPERSESENLFTRGFLSMLYGNFEEAADCFLECVAADDVYSTIKEAAQYNISFCSSLAPGFRELQPAEMSVSHYIDAAVNGAYGPDIADLFKSYYKLPLITSKPSDYNGTIYGDLAENIYFSPSGYVIDGFENAEETRQRLSEEKQSFVESEVSGLLLPDEEYNALIVSVDISGTASYCALGPRMTADEAFVKSYNLDIFNFMRRILEREGFCTLIMTFPY